MWHRHVLHICVCLSVATASVSTSSSLNVGTSRASRSSESVTSEMTVMFVRYGARFMDRDPCSSNPDDDWINVSLLSTQGQVANSFCSCLVQGEVERFFANFATKWLHQIAVCSQGKTRDRIAWPTIIFFIRFCLMCLCDIQRCIIQSFS